MKNEKQISPYNKIRQKLYVTVEKNEKSDRYRYIACALGILLLASVLFFVATLMETSKSNEKYVYYYGEMEQKLSSELALSNNVQLVDMNSLADYCNIEKSSFFSQAVFKINGTEVSFENGSDVARVNGITVKMPSEALIKSGFCLVPLQTVKEILFGITISTDGKQTTFAKTGKDMYLLAIAPEVDYVTDVSEYLDYINSKDEYIFTLANKQNALGENFPEDKDSLIEIPEKYRKSSVIYLYYVAEGALEAMMEDMFAEGLNDVYVTSAYRSYAYQNTLFNMYVEQEMASGLSYEKAREKVLTYSSEPGKSEHQTGLCVDFTTKSIGGVVDESFETTAAFDWLVENSWKYGFILRYPEDKVDITGYSYESWHYRFVGLEIASIIHQTGLSYEEYIQNFN